MKFLEQLASEVRFMMTISSGAKGQEGFFLSYLTDTVNYSSCVDILCVFGIVILRLKSQALCLLFHEHKRQLPNRLLHLWWRTGHTGWGLPAPTPTNNSPTESPQAELTFYLSREKCGAQRSHISSSHHIANM